jgi:hypothetical protein
MRGHFDFVYVEFLAHLVEADLDVFAPADEVPQVQVLRS